MTKSRSGYCKCGHISTYHRGGRECEVRVNFKDRLRCRCRKFKYSSSLSAVNTLTQEAQMMGMYEDRPPTMASGGPDLGCNASKRTGESLGSGKPIKTRHNRNTGVL